MKKYKAYCVINANGFGGDCPFQMCCPALSPLAAAVYATNYKGELKAFQYNQYVTSFCSVPPPNEGGKIFVLVVGPLAPVKLPKKGSKKT